jgi:hypothetical protein
VCILGILCFGSRTGFIVSTIEVSIGEVGTRSRWSCRFPIDRRNGWNGWCGRDGSRSIVTLGPLVEWIRRIVRLVVYRLRTIDITRSSIIVPHLLRFGCSQSSLSWIRVPSFDIFFVSVPIPLSSLSGISKWIGGHTSCCTLVAIREAGREGLIDKVEP